MFSFATKYGESKNPAIITYASTNAVASSGTSSTQTYSSVPIGTAVDDRLVLVAISATSASDNLAVSSATIAGISATIYESAVYSNSGSTMLTIIGAIIPTGTTATVVANFNFSLASVSGCAAFCVSQYKSVNALDTAQNSTNGSLITVTGLDLEIGGIVIAAGASRADTSSLTIDKYAQSLNADVGTSRLAVAYKELTQNEIGSSFSVSSASSNRIMGVGLSII